MQAQETKATTLSLYSRQVFGELEIWSRRTCCSRILPYPGKEKGLEMIRQNLFIQICHSTVRQCEPKQSISA